VHSLAALLQNNLGRLLREDPSIYIDDRLELGTAIPAELVERVTSSRMMLVVLSPRYLSSPWCQTELTMFLQARADATQNVVVIEAERIDRAEWPHELRDMQTLAFWRQDRWSGVPERFDPAPGGETEGVFRKRVNELSYFVANRLRAAVRGAEPELKGDVWIAEPTDDLVDEWEDLAGAVRQAGWRVLPASPYPVHEQGVYTAALERHLSRARLFVQLLGPKPGRRPLWGGPQFPLLQANAARRFAARDRGVTWLRWRTKVTPGELPSDYAALLREGEVQEVPFGEFRLEVLGRLKQADSRVMVADVPPVSGRTATSREATGDAAEPVFVYVHSDDVDRSLAEEIQKSLLNLRVESIATAPVTSDDLPRSIRAAQLQPLDHCDGVILVYGTTPPTWVLAQYALLRKAFAMVRPDGRIGVLSGPPPKAGRLPIFSPAALPLDCAGGVEARVLEQFVQQIRRRPSADEPRV
jgi:hypothetical protein